MNTTEDNILHFYINNYEPDNIKDNKQNSAWVDFDIEKYELVKASCLPASLEEYEEMYSKQGFSNLAKFIKFLTNNPFEAENLNKSSKVTPYNYPLF